MTKLRRFPTNSRNGEQTFRGYTHEVMLEKARIYQLDIWKLVLKWAPKRIQYGFRSWRSPTKSLAKPESVIRKRLRAVAKPY